jgi:hypothetical protein
MMKKTTTRRNQQQTTNQQPSTRTRKNILLSLQQRFNSTSRRLMSNNKHKNILCFFKIKTMALWVATKNRMKNLVCPGRRIFLWRAAPTTAFPQPTNPPDGRHWKIGFLIYRGISIVFTVDDTGYFFRSRVFARAPPRRYITFATHALLELEVPTYHLRLLNRRDTWRITCAPYVCLINLAWILSRCTYRYSRYLYCSYGTTSTRYRNPPPVRPPCAWGRGTTYRYWMDVLYQVPDGYNMPWCW